MPLKALVCVFAVALLLTICFGNCSNQKSTLTTTQIDTVTAVKYITLTDTLIKPVYKYIPSKADTFVSLDTLWLEAAATYLLLDSLPLGSRFIASYDTTAIINNDSITLSVSFASPIPLHPSSRFTLHLQTPVFEKSITKNVNTFLAEPKTNDTFLSRFGISLYAGFGYAESKITPSAGIALTFRIL